MQCPRIGLCIQLIKRLIYNIKVYFFGAQCLFDFHTPPLIDVMLALNEHIGISNLIDEILLDEIIDDSIPYVVIIYLSIEEAHAHILNTAL